MCGDGDDSRGWQLNAGLWDILILMWSTSFEFEDSWLVMDFEQILQLEMVTLSTSDTFDISYFEGWAHTKNLAPTLDLMSAAGTDYHAKCRCPTIMTNANLSAFGTWITIIIMWRICSSLTFLWAVFYLVLSPMLTSLIMLGLMPTRGAIMCLTIPALVKLRAS